MSLKAPQTRRGAPNEYSFSIIPSPAVHVVFAASAASPVFAASFNFSYVFGTGKTLNGTFDGGVALDGDTITSISNVMATYDGALIMADQGWGEASFSGDYLNYGGYLSSLEGGFSISNWRQPGTKALRGGYAQALTCPPIQGGCYFSRTMLDEDVLAISSTPYGAAARPGSWSVSVNDSAPVPEPAAALLFGFGTLMLGGALRGRNNA
jgi:hypothetical protein